VFEVAYSTLKNDRGLKLEIYAQSNIVEYWIVNLPERQLEVYTEPQGKTYQKQVVYSEAMAVSVNLDGRLLGPIKVLEFLP
jgi:Uma2 family endonuclease